MAVQAVMLESEGEDAELVLLTEAVPEADELGVAVSHPEIQTAELILLLTLSPVPALFK